VSAAPEPCRLRAADDRELAAHWFAARERRGGIVINAGTGFPQTFYFKLANYAAERGYDALVYDYRGMGASAPANLATETTRMSDWGLLDMRAALAAAAQRVGGAPLATVGHSIGGQFLGLLKNHALARAHVQIATSVGYWPWERAPFKYLAWWFWRVHGPLMLALKGYIPTGGGWAGLPLPRGVYEEWRCWCMRPDHFGPELATRLKDNVFAQIRAPLLTVGFTDDPIATRRTVDEINKFFPNVERESRWYSPADAGGKRIGHEGFFASRNRDTLWRPVFDWIDARLGVAT
jgi:predicted alpha/beta hydrolase